MDFQVLLNAVGGGRPSLPLFPDDAKGPIMFSELIKVDLNSFFFFGFSV